MYARMLTDDDRRICSTCPPGVLIAFRCRNHPELGAAWASKNIDFLGARTIHYDWHRGTECVCTAGALVHTCGDHWGAE